MHLAIAAAAEVAPAPVLHPALPLTSTEVQRACRDEMARRVEDVLARRSRCLLLDAAAAVEAAPAVARLMAAELGRDERWIEGEIADFARLAEGYRVRA
jgi:glycerol-3-phosphate dehydrogenase